MTPARGATLDARDYIALENSWIDRDSADQAMLRRVDSLEGREIVGQKSRDCAGIIIPYYWPGDTLPFSYRIRRDNPEFECGRDGEAKPSRKYLSSPGSQNRIYLPCGITLEQLQETARPLIFTEGEKKALALWRLANDGVPTPRFIPISIPGVWNWRGTIGKTGGPKGERLDVKGPIPDLDRIQWAGRKVLIVFDSNVHLNESVKIARQYLSKELATRGAKVEFIDLPKDCGVNGIDDLLALWGPEKVLELFETATSATRLEIVQPRSITSVPKDCFALPVEAER